MTGVLQLQERSLELQSSSPVVVDRGLGRTSG